MKKKIQKTKSSKSSNSKKAKNKSETRIKKSEITKISSFDDLFTKQDTNDFVKRVLSYRDEF